jgi:hypothetical protein
VHELQHYGRCEQRLEQGRTSRTWPQELAAERVLAAGKTHGLPRDRQAEQMVARLERSARVQEALQQFRGWRTLWSRMSRSTGQRYVFDSLTGRRNMNARRTGGWAGKAAMEGGRLRRGVAAAALPVRRPPRPRGKPPLALGRHGQRLQGQHQEHLPALEDGAGARHGGRVARHATRDGVLDRGRVRKEPTSLRGRLLLAECTRRHVHVLQDLWTVMSGRVHLGRHRPDA